MKLLVLLLFLTPWAHAESFLEKCPDIPACAKHVGPLLGQKYVFDDGIKGKNNATANLTIHRDNAELLLTNLLYSEGFARIPLGSSGDTFRIVRQRDARDLPLPVATADERMAPRLPELWDLYTLKYKATHADAVEAIARLSRSLMPANARIIPSELSGTILITDAAPNLKKIYALIRENDQKPSAELKKRWKEEEERRVQAPITPPPASSNSSAN